MNDLDSVSCDFFKFDTIDLNSDKDYFNDKEVLDSCVSECVSDSISDTDEKVEKVYCKRCGRTLRGSKSKALGYGPICYELMLEERCKRFNLLVSYPMKG